MNQNQLQQTIDLPDGFVFLNDLQPTGIPDIYASLRYATVENFTGKPVPGYDGQRVILTKPAAEALWRAQHEFVKQGYSLVVYDAYRPQSSVNSFIEWAMGTDQTQRSKYYPFIQKERVFELGYLAKRSEHTRGSAIDLSIIKLTSTLKHPVLVTERQLLDGTTILFLDDGSVDMGCSFDFFGEPSHHTFTALPTQILENRLLLRQTMEFCGFEAYEKEWWHYKFAREPFPDTYFDFPISA